MVPLAGLKNGAFHAMTNFSIACKGFVSSGSVVEGYLIQVIPTTCHNLDGGQNSSERYVVAWVIWWFFLCRLEWWTGIAWYCSLLTPVCSTPPAPHIISPFARCRHSSPYSLKFQGKDYGLPQAGTSIFLLTLRKSAMNIYVDQTPGNLFLLR